MSKTVQIGQQQFGTGRPRICIPIVEKTADEILETAQQLAELPAEVVEWRADLFDEVANLGAVVAVLDRLDKLLKNKLLLFTFRSNREGGSRGISDEDYRTLCKVACETGWIELLDIELSRGESLVQDLLEEAQSNRVGSILSYHNFEQTPPFTEIAETLQAMNALGADFAKVAVMPKDSADVLTLLAATAAFSAHDEHCPCITMAMGPLGKISRLSGELFGSAMTFGSYGTASAPGQIEVTQLSALLTTLQL